MKWIDARLPPANETLVLATGYLDNNKNKGRWYAVARFYDGVYFNDDTGDDFYPPTHYALIEELK